MIGRLFALWTDRRALYRVILVFGAIGVIEGLLFSLLVPLLDELLAPAPRLSQIIPWAVCGIALVLVHWALTVISTPVSFSASFSLGRQLQLRVGNRLIALPLGWFTADHKARVAREVTHSAPKVGGFVGQLAPRLITAVTTPLTVLVTVSFIDWHIGMILLAVLPLAWLVMRWNGRVARRTDEVLDRSEAELTGRTIELAQAQPVLRAAGRAREGSARMQEALDQQQLAYRSALRASIAPRLAYVGILLIVLTGAMATSAWLIWDGQLSAARGTALLVLVVLFMEPLGVVNDAYGGVQSVQVALGRVEDVLRAPVLPAPQGQGARIDGNDIEFDRVWFGYGAEPVLHDLSFRCPAGTTTALVGPSGSGKTTITRLIARFYDVTEGAIRIGGTDLRDVQPRDLMDHLAIVFQDVYLLDDTIEQNLRLAKPDATDDEMRTAARAARLDEVVRRLPDGWQTRVGEGGARLSGGERQRVSIARALLKDAPIVLLDEASAALDPENEALVQEALTALTADGHRTVIMIAHRLATLARADQFIVLDDGGVAECGAFLDLIESGGRFTAMWEQYTHSRDWRIKAAGAARTDRM
jgi:ATP-binding cassette subfamily B protein IrtB